MKKALSMLIVLAIILSCSTGTVYATSAGIPYASKYFSSYSVSLDNDGNTVRANFAVFGTRTLNNLGAKTIYFQRSTNDTSWTTVKTVSYSALPSLMRQNTTVHSASASFTATPGYYYRAYIVLWAEYNGDSEYRHLYTNSIYL